MSRSPLNWTRTENNVHREHLNAPKFFSGPFHDGKLKKSSVAGEKIQHFDTWVSAGSRMAGNISL